MLLYADQDDQLGLSECQTAAQTGQGGQTCPRRHQQGLSGLLPSSLHRDLKTTVEHTDTGNLTLLELSFSRTLSFFS